jgi:hypothetical protein
VKNSFAFWVLVSLLAISGGAAARADEQTFSKQQLDQMLAPIALYPDDLLSNVLMASTYPVDVVDAARWRADPANSQLAGDALVDALKSKDWDPSIKALVQFPDVLKMMDDQLDWTQKLGNAFVAQQDDVMSEVQVLRSRADKSGHLKSTSQQTVAQDSGAYVIRPVEPDTYYVPVYEPSVVYGPWWYPDYPPYYFPYPGIVFTDGYFWGAGIAIAGGIWGWNHWDWRHRRIDINVNRWNAINANRRRVTNSVWKSNPAHRGHVPRGNRVYNRADIERRLHTAGHPAGNVTSKHGAQVRHNAQQLAKKRAARPKPAQLRHGVNAKKFAGPKAAHIARARGNVRRPASHVHRGGRRRR